MNIVINHYRNNFSLKDNEIDLKLSEKQELLAKQYV